MTRVVAILPAYNEAVRVGAAVAALRDFCDEVVVVDDGSTDETAAEAGRAGARVLKLKRNQGKGAALAAGAAAATDAAVVLFADADLAGSAEALRAIVDPVRTGTADLAIAAPPSGGPSGFGLVERFARWGIGRLSGRRMERPISGQRAMRAEVLADCHLDAGFGVDAGITVDALRAGYRVVEVPVSFTHNRTGRTARGFAHRARQGLDIAAAFARRIGRRP
jgi:glycosyltransferase involved in cell wall biosynthesis